MATTPKTGRYWKFAGSVHLCLNFVGQKSDLDVWASLVADCKGRCVVGAACRFAHSVQVGIAAAVVLGLAPSVCLKLRRNCRSLQPVDLGDAPGAGQIWGGRVLVVENSHGVNKTIKTPRSTQLGNQKSFAPECSSKELLRQAKKELRPEAQVESCNF